jgi:hypothetical protein
MKSFSFSLALILSLFFSFSAGAVVNVNLNNTSLDEMTVQDFLDLKYKDYKKISDQKAKFGERVGFLVTKKFLNNRLKSGKIDTAEDFNTAADGFRFRFGAFLWGLFFGLLGLIIVAIFFRRPKKNAIVSCIIGMLLWGTIVGLSV